jgi:hypothetical protein
MLGKRVVVVAVLQLVGILATLHRVRTVDLVVVPVKRTAHLPVERSSRTTTVEPCKPGDTGEEIKLEATDLKRVPVVEVQAVKERTRPTILKGVPVELELESTWAVKLLMLPVEVEVVLDMERPEALEVQQVE